jgi:hypothetical protein
MERGLLGRATVALFDFCAAVHPRSIRPVRRRFWIFTGRIRHLQRR